MNEPKTNNTQWDAYAALSLKFTPVEGRTPFQWIYAVDDAWLHPANLANSELLSPVFEGAGEITHAAWENRYTYLSTPSTRAAPKAAFKPNLADAAVANALISFAMDSTRNGGIQYGICFCSFEYFWEHFMTEINQNQNAVFFDLNHRLRGKDTALNGSWEAKIKTLGLFDSVTSAVNLHGWVLHFAMKFGLVGPTANRIDHNHILIVSSALAGVQPGAEQSPAQSSPDSMNAFQQYATVQKAMWDAMRTAANQSPPTILAPDARMVDFSFSPLPKNVDSADPTANLLELGLKVFDRTFSKAGTWNGVKEQLFHDARNLWTQNKNYGHDPILNQLHFRSWIQPGINDVKMVYSFFADQDYVVISYSLIRRLIEAAHIRQHFENFVIDLPDGADPEVVIPSNPGIVWIATFIEFLDCLKPEWHAGGHNRVAPSLHVSTSDNNLIFSVTLNEAGIKSLNDHYTVEDKTTGATPALVACCKENPNKLANLASFGFNLGKLSDCITDENGTVKQFNVSNTHFPDPPVWDDDKMRVHIKLARR